MHPKISVVIKSYNHAAYVGEAIQSILDQSFQDFEIVVTDDGSNDGTPDAIRRFVDPRIHFEVFNKNRGISVAMNTTIARARGEYIAILNSDDFALPGRLERQVAFLNANPAIAGVFGLPRTVNETGHPAKSFSDFAAPLTLTDYSRTSWLKYFFYCGNCLCAPTAMIRCSVYQRVGTYDPRLTNLQDLDMWVRICTDHDLHFLNEELTAFRIRAGNRNMSAPRNDTLLRSHFELCQILKRYRTMDAGFLRKIFNDDLVAKGISSEGPAAIWLAELALTTSLPAHRLFALEILHDMARDDGDFRRLRDLTGSVDVFGISAIAQRDKLIVERDKRIEEFLNSHSWRITAPMRWVRRLFSAGTDRK